MVEGKMSGVEKQEDGLPPSLYTNRFMIGLTLNFLNEAISINMLVPFVGLLVASFNGGDTNGAGYQSGLLFSVYMGAQFFTAPIWGQISDQLGRKPVLVLGLFLGGFAVLGFGFTTNFWWGLFFRFLHGCTGANVVIAKTMTVEATNAKDEAKGFAVLSGSWSIGCMVGPILGGLLYDPCNAYWLDWLGLSKDGFVCQYPVFLVCLVAAVYSWVASFVCYHNLVETHHEIRKTKPDGHELIGEFLPLLRLFFVERISGGGQQPAEPSNQPEDRNTGEEQQAVGVINSSFVSTASEPQPSRSAINQAESKESSFTWIKCYQHLTIRTLFIMYSFITVPNIILAECIPLFAIADRGHQGLGLKQDHIATFFMFVGLNGIVSASLFSRFTKRFNHLEAWPYLCFVWGAATVLFPFAHYFREKLSDRGVVALFVIMNIPRTFASLYAFSICHMFVANAAPKAVKGAVIGYSQSIAAAARAITPVLMTPLFAWSIEEPRPIPFNVVCVFVCAALAAWVPIYVCRSLKPEDVLKAKSQQQRTLPLERCVGLDEDERQETDLGLELPELAPKQS